ncbi:MAG: hypothetical protein WA162_09360 [Thermodesulfobacteriota bacterium]
MSYYTEIKTELKNRHYILLALEELKKRGEITRYEQIEKKDSIKVDRGGDIMNVSMTKEGTVRVEGDARVVNAFTQRLTQMYAYMSIKENLPLDFEIAKETESAGSITILLKG